MKLISHLTIFFIFSVPLAICSKSGRSAQNDHPPSDHMEEGYDFEKFAILSCFDALKGEPTSASLKSMEELLNWTCKDLGKDQFYIDMSEIQTKIKRLFEFYQKAVSDFVSENTPYLAFSDSIAWLSYAFDSLGTPKYSLEDWRIMWDIGLPGLVAEHRKLEKPLENEDESPSSQKKPSQSFAEYPSDFDVSILPNQYPPLDLLFKLLIYQRTRLHRYIVDSFRQYFFWNRIYTLSQTPDYNSLLLELSSIIQIMKFAALDEMVDIFVRERKEFINKVSKEAHHALLSLTGSLEEFSKKLEYLKITVSGLLQPHMHKLFSCLDRKFELLKSAGEIYFELLDKFPQEKRESYLLLQMFSSKNSMVRFNAYFSNSKFSRFQFWQSRIIDTWMSEQYQSSVIHKRIIKSMAQMYLPDPVPFTEIVPCPYIVDRKLLQQAFTEMELKYALIFPESAHSNPEFLELRMRFLGSDNLPQVVPLPPHFYALRDNDSNLDILLAEKVEQSKEDLLPVLLPDRDSTAAPSKYQKDDRDSAESKSTNSPGISDE